MYKFLSFRMLICFSIYKKKSNQKRDQDCVLYEYLRKRMKFNSWTLSEFTIKLLRLYHCFYKIKNFME